MIQQLLAASPPLAGRLLLSASMLELPLLLLPPPLLLVQSLPELQHALPTCHHAEKNISFTPKIHVTSSQREPQAFTITVKSQSLGVKYLRLPQIGVSVFQGVSVQQMSEPGSLHLASGATFTGIVLVVYRCRDMSEAKYEVQYILTYMVWG